MRSRSLILFPLAFVTACSLWNPDYEPDPDCRLHDLLAPMRDESRPIDAITRGRLRFSIERLATRHPGHVASQVAAGALAVEAGEPQRAQGYVERALSLAPRHVEARCLRVRIAVADGSLDLARKLVDDGLRLRPDAAALYESSAWLHQLEGHMDDAIGALDAAATLGAPGWRIAFHKGLIAELRGDFDTAAELYETAIDENERCAAARQRLAGLKAKPRDPSSRGR